MKASLPENIMWISRLEAMRLAYASQDKKLWDAVQPLKQKGVILAIEPGGARVISEHEVFKSARQK